MADTAPIFPRAVQTNDCYFFYLDEVSGSSHFVFFYSVELYSIARKAHGSGDYLIAIAFAASAVEAFINELALRASVSLKTEKPYQPALSVLAEVLEDAESCRMSVQGKYRLAKQLLTGKPLETDKSPYQDFNMLFQLRNALLHMKPGATLDDQEAEHKKLVKMLLSHHLCNNPPMASFLDNIKNANVSRFACNAAAAIIDHIDECCSAHKLATPLSIVDTEPEGQFRMGKHMFPKIA